MARRFCHSLLSILAFISLWLSMLCAAEPSAVFTGISLTQMIYYPQMGITETRVRQAMGDTIASHDGIIDFATVQDVASRITALYRGAGFVFTRAYIPQQYSTNGWIEVRLLQGWLSTVDVFENQRYNQEVLAQPFADLLGKVVYSPEIEEAMAMLNDYPGLNAFGFYSVGEEPGSTRLNVRVQRERNWTGALRADNHGAELTGRTRLLAELEKFNPTGNADHLRVGTLQTIDPDNAKYGVIEYELPIIDKRSHLALRASSDTFVVSRGAEDQQFEFKGRMHSAQIEYRRKIKRSNAVNRSVHTTIRRDISNSELKNIETIEFEEKSWEIETGFDFDYLDRKRSYWIGGGIDITAGRYDEIDVPGQNADYYLARGFVTYTKGITLRESTHQAKLSFDAQYSRDLLPAVSQYSLTGPPRLRGFLSSEFSADSAVIGVATWVFPSFSWSKKGKLFDKKSDTQPEMTTSLFAEYGYGVQNVPTASYNDNWGYMADMGAAWQFKFGPDLSATVTVASPLSHRISYQDQNVSASRVWMELLWRFH